MRLIRGSKTPTTLRRAVEVAAAGAPQPRRTCDSFNAGRTGLSTAPSEIAFRCDSGILLSMMSTPSLEQRGRRAASRRISSSSPALVSPPSANVVFEDDDAWCGWEGRSWRRVLSWSGIAICRVVPDGTNPLFPMRHAKWFQGRVSPESANMGPRQDREPAGWARNGQARRPQSCQSRPRR